MSVLNINNGVRPETYMIPAERNSGDIALNGAAARLAQPGNKAIMVFYSQMTDEEACAHRPKVAIVDEHNKIVEIRRASAFTAHSSGKH